MLVFGLEENHAIIGWTVGIGRCWGDREQEVHNRDHSSSDTAWDFANQPGKGILKNRQALRVVCSDTSSTLKAFNRDTSCREIATSFGLASSP